MELELLDRPHSDPKGVREAKHIIRGIGLDKNKEQNYVTVAIEQNREVVERYSNNG